MLHEPRINFYRHVIDEWIPDRDATVLVVGGGENDRDVFQSLGFNNVTITNVATALDRADCNGFRTLVVDAERMDLPDKSYDYTVVHAVLHHCASPHAGLLELYRVARKAAIFIEVRDSFTGNTVDCQRGWTVKAILVRLLVPLYRVFVRLCPGQQNLFAARINKPIIPRDLYPWLILQDGMVVFNQGWSPNGSHGRAVKADE